MKKLLIIAALIGGTAWAQQHPDQNPNHERGMNVYMDRVEELTQTMGTTVQDTYVAIDDTNKGRREARRKERRERRHELRMARANNPSYYNNYRSGWGRDALWLGSSALWYGSGCNNPSFWLWY